MERLQALRDRAQEQTRPTVQRTPQARDGPEP